uniref:Tn7 reverse transcriptase n=1 Tax=Solanum tuberosum TaxID=4113 RepID=M1D135_SOLTU
MPLVEKVTEILRCWSAKLLSYAGRLQLIKAVVFGVRTCWAQVFVLPKRIMKLINGIYRTFVCSDVVLSKRARVFQEKICLSKAAGGLKVMHLISWNRAAILKHSWAIAET